MRSPSFASPARTHGTRRKRRRNEADLPGTGERTSRTNSPKPPIHIYTHMPAGCSALPAVGMTSGCFLTNSGKISYRYRGPPPPLKMERLKYLSALSVDKRNSSKGKPWGPPPHKTERSMNLSVWLRVKGNQVTIFLGTPLPPSVKKSYRI